VVVKAQIKCPRCGNHNTFERQESADSEAS